jgi:hypothetical protein
MVCFVERPVLYDHLLMCVYVYVLGQEAFLNLDTFRECQFDWPLLTTFNINAAPKQQPLYDGAVLAAPEFQYMLLNGYAIPPSPRSTPDTNMGPV